MKKVLITGGTGFIGQALTSTLIAAGNNVTVVTRDPGSQAALPESGQYIKTVPASEHWDFDVVVNLAGENLFESRWSAAAKQRFIDSRVSTTATLVERISEQENRPLLISGSAIGYYGASDDRRLSENARPGTDFPARLCCQWEQEANKAQGLGVPTALLRTGVVLDPAGGALKRMSLPFKLGLGGQLGNGQQWFSWISRDDIVRLILFIMERHFAGEHVSGAWNATSPVPVTNREFTKAMGAAVKRPTLIPVPGWLLRLTMGEAAHMLLTGQRVIPERALNDGFLFRDPEIGTALKGML